MSSNKILAATPSSRAHRGMSIKRYEDLEVWQYADEVMAKTYAVIVTLPEREKYNLMSQMRRSAMSIPCNIVEGFGRRHANDKIRFYETSYTSTQELKYQYHACKRLGYVKDPSDVVGKLDSICRMLKSMIRKTPDMPTAL
jgi:four helix bundle protein